MKIGVDGLNKSEVQGLESGQAAYLAGAPTLWTTSRSACPHPASVLFDMFGMDCAVATATRGLRGHCRDTPQP